MYNYYFKQTENAQSSKSKHH